MLIAHFHSLPTTPEFLDRNSPCAVVTTRAKPGLDQQCSTRKRGAGRHTDRQTHQPPVLKPLGLLLFLGPSVYPYATHRQSGVRYPAGALVPIAEELNAMYKNAKGWDGSNSSRRRLVLPLLPPGELRVLAMWANPARKAKRPEYHSTDRSGRILCTLCTDTGKHNSSWDVDSPGHRGTWAFGFLGNWAFRSANCRWHATDPPSPSRDLVWPLP